MYTLLYFLIFCNIAIPFTVIVKQCTSKQGVEVNHISLFSLAFVFYFISPVCIGIAATTPDDIKHFVIWHHIFKQVSCNSLNVYMIVCLGCYISFIGGNFISAMMLQKKYFRFKTIHSDIKLLNILLIIGIVIGIISAYTLKDVFFSGYLDLSNTANKWRGMFIFINIFILSLSLLYTSEFHIIDKDSLKGWKIIFNKFFIVFAVFLILLVSLGGRTWIISAIVMYIMYYSIFIKRTTITQLFLFFFTIVMLSTLIALWRGGTTFEYSKIMSIKHIKNSIVIMFVDSTFLSISLMHFLKEYTLPLINYPVFLLSNLINIIPTILLPDKSSLILKSADYGYIIRTDNAGAIHSFVSLMINFGVIGSFIFWFVFSFLINILKDTKTSVYRTMYVMISGWMAISLFRDFETTVIKLILQLSIIIPLLILLLSYIISHRANVSQKT